MLSPKVEAAAVSLIAASRDVYDANLAAAEPLVTRASAAEGEIAADPVVIEPPARSDGTTPDPADVALDGLAWHAFNTLRGIEDAPGAARDPETNIVVTAGATFAEIRALCAGAVK